jgi:hypothetical protein
MSDAADNEKKDPFLGVEITDRAARRAEREKKRAEAKAIEKELLENPPTSQLLLDKEKKKKKKLFNLGLAFAGLCFFIWALSYLFTPYKGDERFGVCKVFLENTVRFPMHLRLSSVEDFGTSIRIWYAQTDAFGAFKLESIQCFYKSDEQRGTFIEKITINRRAIDQSRVDAFNAILPIVLQNLPDLTYPSPLPNSLNALKIEADKFRKALNL